MLSGDESVISVSGIRLPIDDAFAGPGITFSVSPHEVFVIMGTSGSGKTTLFKHLIGLQKPVCGEISLLGKPLHSLKRTELFRLRRQIGVAFQNGALFSSLTVAENIELPLRHHTNLEPDTIRIMSRLKLELVNLAGCADLMPAQLSGGMLKRASIARAAVLDPPILFFDEPTTGLDRINAAELDELLLKLRQALRATLIIVTHDLDSAFNVADRIMVIDKGSTLTIGTPDEIRASADTHVMNLLNRRPAAATIDGAEYLRRLTESN